MTDNTQPEAVMQLADAYADASFDQGLHKRTLDDAPENARSVLAAAVRRQHARIAELEAQLESIGAGGVSGPLMDRTDSKESEAFEAFVRKRWGGSDRGELRRQEKPYIGYVNGSVDFAWAAFQAGRASLAASAGSEPVIGWHAFPHYLQHPDGRLLRTASDLLARHGYQGCAEPLRAIHQAIDLIGEPDTERLRTVRRVLRGAVVVAEDSTAPQADSQPAPDEAVAMSRTRDLAEAGRWPSDWVEAYRRGYSDRAARPPADSVTAPVGGETYHLGACIVEDMLHATVMRKEPGRAGAVTVLLSEQIPVEHLQDRDVIVNATPPAQAADSVLEDAARYRWLRATTNYVTSNGERIDVRNTPEKWDAAIDAARAAQEGNSHG